MTYHGHIAIKDIFEITGRGTVMTVDDDTEYKVGDTFYYGHIYEIRGVELKRHGEFISSHKGLLVRRAKDNTATFPLAATPPYVPTAPQSEIRKVWMVVLIILIMFWSAVFYFGCS